MDVVEQGGRMIEIYRPLDGSPTVRDAVTGDDLTDQFLVHNRINLLAVPSLPETGAEKAGKDPLRIHDRHLAHFGIDTSEAPLPVGHEQKVDPQLAAKASEEDAVAEGRRSQQIQTLATINQDLLWATGMALAETEHELARLRSIGDGNPAGTRNLELPDSTRPSNSARDLIEDCHAAVEQAADKLESDRSLHLTLAATLTLIALIGAVAISAILAIPFLLAAIIAGSISAWRWRQLLLASQAEDDALEAAGLTSYLKLRMTEVDDQTIVPPTQRLQLEKIHALASEAWTSLVGCNTSLEFAVANHSAISQAVSTGTSSVGRAIRSRLAPEFQTAAEGSIPTLGATPFLLWLDSHLESVRSDYKQCVPVVLDENFLDMHPVPPALGEALSSEGLPHQTAQSSQLHVAAGLLRSHAKHLQLVVMTDNAELLRLFPTSEGTAQVLCLRDRLATKTKQTADTLLDLRA